MPRIFISYRRDDSAGHAGRLYDRLEGHFGQGQVFMDVDAIRPGLNFVDVVEQAISVCDGLVAVIGREWLQASDGAGTRRLEDPADLVKLEIATALERNIRVIPVLVQGAEMPRAGDLPEELKELAQRNALEVGDNRFRSDVDRLIEALGALGAADDVFVEPTQLGGSVVTPPVHPSEESEMAPSGESAQAKELRDVIEPESGPQPLPDQPMPPGMKLDGLFVGRQRELGELKISLDEAISGKGRVSVIAGETGIGKTRTAQELVVYAESQEVEVLWGRCHVQGAPAYWPWIQIIRSYIRAHDPDEVRSHLPLGSGYIAEIVLELREILPHENQVLNDDPEQAKFSLFDSVTEFFKLASQARPMLLILDNIHSADKLSLQLLEFLTQEISESHLMLLGTFQDAELTRRHPLNLTLGELTQELCFRRTTLRGLSESEVTSFVETALGFTPPQELADTVYRQTGGNPLFITELLRLLEQDIDLSAQLKAPPQSWNLGIPVGVQEVISRRLDRLSQRCNDVLTVASVIGREFDLVLLERLVNFSEDDPLAVVEEALAARVIEELPNTLGRYQFSNALVQETLARELSAVRRARLHAQIGEALEGIYGNNLEAHATELAYRFEEAGSATPPEKLTKYSILAGEQALSRTMYEEALLLFQRAVSIKEASFGEGPGMDAETASALFGLGRAQAATLPRHQLGEAVDSLVRAFDYFASEQTVVQAVAVAEFPFIPPVGNLSRVVQLIDRALKMVPPDSHEAARLLSRHGMVLGMAEGGDYAHAQQAFQDSLEIARRVGDLSLEMRTLAWGARVDRFHLKFDDCLAKSNQVIRLAQRVEPPDLYAQVQAHRLAANMLTSKGDLDSVIPQASAMLELAEQMRDRYWRVTAYIVNERQERLQGNWDKARDFCDRGLAIAPSDPRLLCTRTLLEYEVGEGELGQDYLKKLLEATKQTPAGTTSEYGSPAVVIPLIALITNNVQLLDLAQERVDDILSPEFGSPQAPLVKLVAQVGKALLAVVAENPIMAAVQYDILEKESIQGTILPTGIAMCADLLLGLVAWSASNQEMAKVHFEEALIFCRNAGCRPYLGWASYYYARTLRADNGLAARGRCASLLGDALAISEELGMRYLKEQVVSLSEAIRSPQSVPVYPDGLTQREVEVLRLIGLGSSNQQVAEELVITVRTVTNHVSNIFAKTGANNRVEAATYAIRNNLLSVISDGPVHSLIETRH